MWALYTTMIVVAHASPVLPAAFAGARAIAVAAILGLAVQRLADRIPWPRVVRPRFILIHAVGAIAYAAAWVLLASLVESLVQWRAFLLAPAGLGRFLILGVWLYLTIAAVSYTVANAQRVASAEAAAARTQLSALRSQLHPHFLFNALHTVVQLIPLEPRRAAIAAEQVATLLRTTLEEERDLVPLRDELALVERYLAIERLRFGDRLVVHLDVSPTLHDALVPSFLVQTLVENAIRHGAAPRVEPTTVRVAVASSGGRLRLAVTDTGMGSTPESVQSTAGSGLRRLRERLRALHGTEATLDITTTPGTGFSASVTIPLATDGES